MAQQFTFKSGKKHPKGKAGKPVSPQKGVSQFGLPKGKLDRMADQGSTDAESLKEDKAEGIA